MIGWQKLIWAVLFLVVFEGALRKWVLPGFQAQIYLVKDAILAVAYIGFISSRVPVGVHSRALAGLRTLMVPFVIYFGLELFNPNSPSMLLSVIGLKNYLLYVPLAFIVPYMFSSTVDLERKLKIYAITMIPFAALGLVQFASGPDHWINGYLSHDTENLRQAAMFGSEGMEKARTTGTFSYISGFVTFLTVMIYLGLGLTVGKKWRILESRWSLSLLVVSIAAVFTTGSRTPLFTLVITAPVVLFIWVSKGLMSSQGLLRMGLACGIIFIILQYIAPEAISAYEYRAGHTDDPIVRALSPFTELYEAIQETSGIGTGMASTHASAITVTGSDSYWWLGGKFFEAEPARVMFETGFVGFLLVYGARMWLLVRAIMLGVRFRKPLHVAMSGVIAGLFAQFPAYNIINNPTGGIYYWFAAGLLFAMYRLELQEEYARGRKLQREPVGHAGHGEIRPPAMV